MRGLTRAEKVIRASQRIVISCHINPDGDAIGSMLALGLGLRLKGKQVVMVSADPVPKVYRSLPGADLIRRSIQRKERFDLAIAVDCSYRHMLGSVDKVFGRTPLIMALDHHLEREAFGPLDVVDPQAAAMAEIIYVLFKKFKVGIDRPIAENLLTSIIVETNSYRLPSVRPLTFRISAALAATGLNYTRLTEHVYWAVRKEAALLMGIALRRSCFLKNGQVVWTLIKRSDFEQTGGREEDIDPMPDELRAIQGVKIAVLFRETSRGRLRVSLRSKGHINVGRVARKYGGGGHFDVAGCFLSSTARARNRFLADVLTLIH